MASFLTVVSLLFGIVADAGLKFEEYNEPLPVLPKQSEVSNDDVPISLPSTVPIKSIAAYSLNLPGHETLPVVIGESLSEPVLQENLKHGAVLLPMGTTLGQSGNVVITAHSSGPKNIGKLRSAFAQISKLEVGDTYTIDTKTASYTYKVFSKDRVLPSMVDSLPNKGKSTVTLVTCWPIWTDFMRLIVNSELVNVEYIV
jgi:LPXTG-site transpeptidase (sortase) family protein